MVAGDFSNFDGSLLMQVLVTICDHINKWYNDGEENAQIRRILFEHLFNCDVYVDGQIIRQTHSQPSGNPATVVINCCINSIAIRMAMYECWRKSGQAFKDIPDFDEVVAFASYGDDNVMNISDKHIGWFNQLTITEAMAINGFTYTDEAKTGVLVPYRRLEDVAFLKRGFTWNPEWQCHFAPMALDNILDITNWVRGNTPRQSTEENMETILRELALHGRDVYNYHSQRVRETAMKHGLRVRVPAYDYFEMILASSRGQV